MINEGNIFMAIVMVTGFLIILLGIAFLIIWAVLPFSIFGLKGLMKEAIQEQKRTNELLKEMLYRRTTHEKQEGGE
ncbi:MAG: hypothetical protein HY878_04245 [Deltaproteobacteria bacterium]|nr:hypothetical protein [Deltaproteobacteria bacterium]